MPFVSISWLPKACRTAAVRAEVAEAVLKALTSVKSAEVLSLNFFVKNETD